MGTGTSGPRLDQRHNARVELIYFDAGGGHRASAAGLSQVLGQQFPHWQVTTVNLRERLDSLDYLRRLTGVRLENFYNGLLRKGLALGIGPMLRVLHLLIREMHPKMVRMLADGWCQNRPDLVVSLIPHFNRTIFEGLRRAALWCPSWHAPMVTIMTDFADYPPHFWIERQEQYVICGTAAAARQALAVGLPANLVLRSSGMIVRPEFYRSLPGSRAAERLKLGLDPHRLTGVVMFGGFGSRRMETIAQLLGEADLPIQLIFMCGRNEILGQRLAALKLPYPHRILGFTDEVPHFLQIADFFVGKPGPGSISEALVCGLPVIVERNLLTMVHERFNTDWIIQNGLGIVVRSFAEIAAAVGSIIDPGNLLSFRRNLAAHENRAVFEIPAMLDGILKTPLPQRSRSRLSA